MRSVAIVEDDLAMRDVTRLILEQAGFRVSTFGSGWEILKACLEQGEQFDAVVLDILMFGLSGLEVAEQLHATTGGKRTRLVFVSSRRAALEAAEGTWGDSAHYLEKPFAAGDLLGTLTA